MKVEIPPARFKRQVQTDAADGIAAGGAPLFSRLCLTQDQGAGPDRETLTRQLQECHGQTTQLRGRLEELKARRERVRDDVRAMKAEIANITQSLNALRCVLLCGLCPAVCPSPVMTLVAVLFVRVRSKKRNDIDHQNRQIANLVTQLERDFQKEAEEQKTKVKQAVRQHLQALRMWKVTSSRCCGALCDGASCVRG